MNRTASPADYHLTTIASALEAHTRTPTNDLAAELQILVTDAAAALADHVQFGKVKPSSLDKRWNVDPRVGAPPLDATLGTIAAAPSIDQAIEALKPKHFIYQGLKQVLARMRTLAGSGGWPAVPPGAAIKPGGKDPRIAIIRKRLAATGELAGASAGDQSYGADLQAAGKNFQAHHRLTEDGVIGKGTIDAMNVTAEARVAQLRANLERARWVVEGLGDTSCRLPAFKVTSFATAERLGSAHADRPRSPSDADLLAEMKYFAQPD